MHPVNQDVLDHWKKYLPKMTAELESQGTLNQSLQEKVDLMQDQYVDLVQGGMDPNKAMELSRPLAYLPAEDEESESPNEPPPATTA
jgi:hypothetical protein